MISSRRILTGTLLLAFAFLTVAARSIAVGAETDKPNIVYILADDLGYGDLGCYGQKLIQTPNIDRIAREGIRFTDHYAGSNVCAPSRCVLMTGLHTGHCYIRNNRALTFEGNVPIPNETVTVAEYLKTAGYATAAIGKWGLGFPGSEGDPTNQGFDLFFGYNCQRQAHSYYPDHLWRNRDKVTLPGNAGNKQTQYSHDLMTDEALNFVKQNKGRPFFLYMPYTIPHLKWQVPDLGPYADKSWPENMKTQAAMITRMDCDVGRIMKLIEDLGLDEETVVFFASDNGAHGAGETISFFNACAGLRAKKGTMYEGGLRVPLVARWPGKIAPGRTTDHVSSFQDMLPTFCELAGVKVDRPIDGISMVPTLLGHDGQQQHEYLYWERAKAIAVRMGDWKVVKGKRSLELFDLKSDPHEENDVSAEHAELVARMEQIIQQSHVQCPSEGLSMDLIRQSSMD